MPKAPMSGLFGSSPIKPLQQHMASVQECVAQLLPYINAVLAGDWDAAASEQAKISQMEREADKLKRELRLNLPNSLFMPVSRRDLLEVLTMQDKIANKARSIAGLILGRKMKFPESLGPAFRAFIEKSIETSAQAQKAINELDELVETGFRGHEVKIVTSMINTLDALESETDKIQVQIRAGLAQLETELPPIDVMFLYKIIDWIGDLGDRAQQVGSRLELLLAR
ncbi:MAG TPA: TIGR00153 family protein [Gammaproteobacteria bacterium]|jgi:predicted phosphate transport protein (TIGR00153 family)|nr:TIGR00153 family protein [Gammaproteobacteria bacterium]